MLLQNTHAGSMSTKQTGDRKFTLTVTSTEGTASAEFTRTVWAEMICEMANVAGFACELSELRPEVRCAMGLMTAETVLTPSRRKNTDGHYWLGSVGHTAEEIENG